MSQAKIRERRHKCRGKWRNYPSLLCSHHHVAGEVEDRELEIIMRYRGNGKIKHQHGMIKGLRKILNQIAKWDEVQGIIPGRIEVAKQGGKPRLRVSYKTGSGLKAIARGNGSVQEIFFITDNSDAFLEKLATSKFLG